MLPYDQLLSMLGKLRFKDDTALRTIGLAPLAKKYDAYPVADHQGGRHYCLLAKGSEVPTARKITPASAMSQIIVLKADESNKFAKVWPHGTKDSHGAAPPEPKAEAKEEHLGSLEIVED